MLFNKKYKVTVKNKNITLEVKAGSNLYKTLKENNIPVNSLCDGSGQCGKCKVKVTSPGGSEINKPTKKDRLILALINLENGYRLACEYIVKSDIIIDTEEWGISENRDPNIVGVKKKQRTNANSDIEATDVNVVQREQENDKNNESTNRNINEETQPNDQTGSDSGDDFTVTDGLMLIQYPNSVKYYVYTAGINNISSEGLIKVSEHLTNIIDNNTLSDFIYDNIEIPDLERVIIILDRQAFDGEILFNLVNYFPFEIGTLKCEIIQPYNDSRNLLTFLRLLNSVNGQNLQIALDNLAYSYYLQNGTFYFLNSRYVTDSINLESLMSSGKNPIIDISDDLSQITLKDNLFEPDSIALPAILKTIKILLMMGAIDENFTLKSRSELVDKLKLEHLVKFSKRNEENLFFIFRKKDNEIAIRQSMLDNLKDLKVFLITLTEYVQKELGTIENVIIQNLTHYDFLINNLFDLSILPKHYSKKTKFYSGDPTLLAAKFFTVSSIKAYFGASVESLSEITLYKDETFNKIYDKIDNGISPL